MVAKKIARGSEIVYLRTTTYLLCRAGKIYYDCIITRAWKACVRGGVLTFSLVGGAHITPKATKAEKARLQFVSKNQIVRHSFALRRGGRADTTCNPSHGR